MSNRKLISFKKCVNCRVPSFGYLESDLNQQNEHIFPNAAETDQNIDVAWNVRKIHEILVPKVATQSDTI